MKILADWGTTNLRGWLVDGAGAVVARHESAEGVKVASAKGFASCFEALLRELGATGEVPALISGMAGSTIGWVNVDYAPLPVTAGDLAAKAVPIPAPFNGWILGGASTGEDAESPEVMRGEEVQALGVRKAFPEARWICLPGTHSKWVGVSEGRLEKLSTFLTGETFDWVVNDSIISTQITESKYDEAAFIQGLELARSGMPLTRALFQMRSRFLFGKLEGDTVFAAASGLLIGHEILEMAREIEDPIHLCGSGRVVEYYQRALEFFGFAPVVVDSDKATLDGLLAVWDKLPH